jgi:hypothetical protein
MFFPLGDRPASTSEDRSWRGGLQENDGSSRQNYLVFCGFLPIPGKIRGKNEKSAELSEADPGQRCEQKASKSRKEHRFCATG